MNLAYISKDARMEQDCLRPSLVRIDTPAVSITEMWRHLPWLYTLLLSSLIHLLMALPAAAAVTVTELAAIRMPASADSGVTTLRIRSDKKDSLMLSAGEFVDRSTKDVLPGTVAFEPKAREVKPNQPYEFKVTASKILFEGEAEVDVRDRGVKIGSLMVARAPFAVTIPKAKLLFRQALFGLFGPGEKTLITLRNDARYSYDMCWMMQIDAHKYYGEGEKCEQPKGWARVNIPPKNEASIEIQPPPDWFCWTGLFFKETKEATLSLAFPGDLPKHAFKLEANLQGALYPVQLLWILALLTIGALCSLIVQHWVPNIRRKGELKEQIRRVRLKIDGFSPDIESSLRVQAQVQRDLLDALRKSTCTILPLYETVAAQCSQGITMLERRVDLIEEIDSVYEKQRVRWETSLPPSIVEKVEDQLRGASEGLRKAQLSEAEFTEIKAQIHKAKTLTEQMGTPNSTFKEDLKFRLQSIQNELPLFKEKATSDQLPLFKEMITCKDAYTDLSDKLPGLFKMLTFEKGNRTPPIDRGAPSSNTQGDSSSLDLSDNLMDYNLLALKICRNYIWLFAGTTDGKLQKKLSGEIKDKLVEHLGRQSCSELQEARLLLEQFRQDIGLTQVWEAINPEEMYIVYEPAEIHYFQLVQFRVAFRREGLNWAAAREFVVPEWDFGDGRSGCSCWMPQYCFSDRRKKLRKRLDWIRTFLGRKVEHTVTVKVRFRHFGDRTNNTAKPEEKTLCEPVHVRTDPTDDRWTRTFNEFVALLVSILVPLGALVAGAQEHLAQNSVGGALMVFLLGFSSDTVISVFKQRV